MSAERIVISGVVKNGLIVPDTQTLLPDGTRVEIVITPPLIPANWQAEMAAWERLSDEAWGLIDEWEREDKP